MIYGKVLDFCVGGAGRVGSVMAPCAGSLFLLEFALRALRTGAMWSLTSVAQVFGKEEVAKWQWNYFSAVPKAEVAKEEPTVSNLFGIRTLLKTQTPQQLLLHGGALIGAGMVLGAAVDKFGEPPIKLFNTVGKIAGLQLLQGGLIHNPITWDEITQVFTRMPRVGE